MSEIRQNELAEILRTRGVRSVLQPIVDLSAGRTVVAYEALARGPRGSSLERPDVLLAEARASHRIEELDALCRRSALDAGVVGGLLVPYSLFINVEPDALYSFDAVSDGPPHPLAVLELTERALTLEPAQLVRSVTRLREKGWAIAIDDLGVNPHSLALLPLLAPDVIKLDMSLVQQRPGQHTAMIMNAVAAHAEATGALVLAEGIETDEHLAAAHALGADLGQGWLFGRPVEAHHVSGRGVLGVALNAPQSVQTSSQTPFDVVVGSRVPKVSHKELLIQVSRFLESRALRGGDSAVILATFQYAENFTPRTRRMYREIASTGAIVAVLAHGLTDDGALPEGHAIDLAADDPLTGEWDVAVVSPDFAALLTAREVSSTSGREFEFVLTHNRRLVLAAAHTLLGRLTREQDVRS